MKEFKKTAIAVGVAQVVWMASGAAFAQTAPAADSGSNNSVVVVGQRAALESAAQIKKNSDEIVDSIVADDIGKLPDKSVTEVLQRIPGVTIDRTLNRVDPLQGVGDGIQHFAAEGTGVSVRGLSYVRGELNGRDAFSANGGRSLSFEDVPPELMAAVDVYKNPSAQQIEGAIGGLVNLRTALPFDYKGAKGALNVEYARSQLRGEAKPSFSGMLSNRWDTELGQFGALIDLAHSEIATRSDGMSISPYVPRTDAVIGDNSGQLRWISPGVSWTTNNFERERDGLYGAFQWKKGDVSSALTFFKSKYKMHTTENAFFLATSAGGLTVDPGATFGPNGNLLTGTLRNPQQDGLGNTGIGFGTDSRAAGRTADTSDLSWNVKWKASEQWAFQADLQHVRASSDGYDNTIGLAGLTQKETVNLGVSPASVTYDAADRAYLADPNNYHWDFAQEHRDKSVATLNAARLDATFTFDHPVLQDFRFGVRATERSAITQATHDSDWANIAQSWSVGNSWQPLGSYPIVTDPRFAAGNQVLAFNNFFGGQISAPASVVIPNPSLVVGNSSAPPASFQTLHDYTQVVCKPGCPDWTVWHPAAFGDDKGLNEQHERTQAAYGQLRFGFDQLPFPVDGNAGVRVVHTDMSAVGYTLFSPPTAGVPGVPVIAPQADKQTFKNSYTNALPSLNLRMKVNNDLQFRFAAAKGITRPDFYQMQAYTTLSQTPHTHQDSNGQTILESIDYTGSARGNPMLKPVQSNNLDLTAEYYFGKGNSLTLSLFNKQLKDIIIGRTSFYTLNDVTGQPHDFLVSRPVNGATGRASGMEVGYQQYFDKLPGLLSGFGVSANYTYIDSRMNLNAKLGSQWCTPKDTLQASEILDLAGCDSDGRAFGTGSGMPMTGMSKNAYNLQFLYDKGPWSARLAYSWRSKYLQAVNAYGATGSDGIDMNPDSPNYGKPGQVNYALPVWGGSYGQLDMGIHYKVTDNMSVAFEARNLNDAIYKQYVQQGIGMMEKGAYYTGRSYTLQASYSF